MSKSEYLILLAFAVTFPAAGNNPYISEIHDYLPAPGQWVNEIPEWESGDTREDVLNRVREALVSTTEPRPGMISLGAFGGYVVFSFDHPVINVEGEYDFRVYGNAFAAEDISTGGSAEPGIVMVSVDANGNKLPDDEWYELVGADFEGKAKFPGYEVTYYRTPDGHTPVTDGGSITDSEYIRWTSNDPAAPEGYIQKLKYHTQNYWPGWIESSTLTFKGTRLPSTAYKKNGSDSEYILPFFNWGYVDNRPNDINPGFKLDWAVKADGSPANLTHADFIKVYTGQQQTCGWIGETSTEVAGAEDLHPDAQSGASLESVTAPSFRIIGCEGSTLRLISDVAAVAVIYGIDGTVRLTAPLCDGRNIIDLSALPRGIYILAADGRTAKIIL